MRGRPRARRSRTGSVGEMGGSSADGSVFTSASCSSVSSIFGTISSEAPREPTRASDGVSEWDAALASKEGVSAGESLLDDMEGCGEELMLRRACAPGGGCPKERVEIIRPGSDCGQWLPVLVGRHWTPRSFLERRRGAGAGCLRSRCLLLPGSNRRGGPSVMRWHLSRAVHQRHRFGCVRTSGAAFTRESRKRVHAVRFRRFERSLDGNVARGGGKTP